MPKNKNALIRYRVINRCFKEKGNVSLEQLIRACEEAIDIAPISERTIEADIHAMRYDSRLGYNAPIKRDRVNKVYYYENLDYSIDDISLSEEELESLVFAARLLEQYKDIEIFSTFSDTVQNLVDAVNVYRLTENDTNRNFIEFETVETSKGTEHLETLITAIKNQQVITIEYKSFTAKKSTHNIIHPYHLKEYRNRWFLIGYNEKYDGIRTYGLERMISICDEENERFIDKGFDAREYYKNVIGISVLDKDPVEIHIAYTEKQAQYVITQPLHHSQELVSEAENRFVFMYFLVPNFEFYQQILGWGVEVEIIEPKTVIDEYHSVIDRIRKNR